MVRLDDEQKLAVVSHPNIGAYAASDDPNNIAGTVLYWLAVALVRSSETPSETVALKQAMSDGALHAWAMCEKSRADAFKEAAEIVESMSGVEEGRSDHATSDAAWAAIKLQDAAEKIRERAAKTNHITHALVTK